MSKFDLDNIERILIEKIGLNHFSLQIKHALTIAYKAHTGQFRESGNNSNYKIPYITHPVGVAINAHTFLENVSLDDTYDDIISACLTHDVIEDSEYGEHDLEVKISKRVSKIVGALTKPIIKEELTREKRNRLANNKIIESGKTAMFIKICDHSHNIGQPRATPPKLLQKAISKGYQYYLDYFGEDRLPETLKEKYISLLTKAESYLDKHHQESLVSNNRTLEQAVSYCDQKSSSKILEMHDISDVIKAPTGALFSRIKNYTNFVGELTEAIDKKLKNKWSSKLEGDLLNNWVDIYKYPKEITNKWQLGCDHLYVSSVDFFDSEDPLVIICGYKQSKSSWVNKTTIDFLVNNLSTRLRFQIEKRKKELAEEIGRLSLSTDVSTALSHNLRYKELSDIKSWLDSADIAHLSLLSVIKHTVQNIDSDLPQVNSRLKTVTSILNKARTRKIKSYYNIDDLIGARVVCLTHDDVNEYSIKLVASIVKSFLVKEDNIEIKNVSTPSGYEATHIYFSLNFDSDTPEIPCEIQIKTVFQDSWAKAYRNVVYGSGSPKPRTKKLFKELSIKCEEADEITKKITSS